MLVKADIHIHTCLSPCGSLYMSPRRIIDTAQTENINLIAITDHNSTLNCSTAGRLAEQARNSSGAALFLLPGMEISTREEVHVLGFFPDLSVAFDFNQMIYETLPDIPNDPYRFGDQVYVDENDMILGEPEKYLGNSTALSLEEAVSQIHAYGGICIPAHIDRAFFGAVSQLGFLPDLPYEAVEVLQVPPPPMPRQYPAVQNSDAHLVEDIGRRCFTFSCSKEELESSPFTALRRALENNFVTICS